MIHVTRINDEPIVINSDLIEYLESTPDTVIALSTGQRFIVLENLDEIIRRIIAFRRELQSPLYCALRNVGEPAHAGGPAARS